MLNNETKLLLFLSRVCPEESVLDRAQALIDGDIDWASVFLLSGDHGTFGLICKNLSSLKRIPGDVFQRFENAYHNALRRNILNISEHDKIIEGLNDIGIDVISLKGPAASEEIFGDVGVYPAGDIDILVKVKDITATRESLEARGYILTDKGFDDYREYFLKERYHISLSDGRYTVEPHWNLFFRYFTTPPEFWWDESIVVDSGGGRYRFLSPEKNVLYNSFRLFSKAFRHLRFLAMVAELVRYYHDEIDWGKMFVYAERYNFERVLRIVLRMSVRLLGAPVPEKYAVLKGRCAKALYKASVKMLFSGTDPDPVRKMLLAFMRDDPSGPIKVLYRRLFPSMGEIVSRYQLSARSGKAIVYYILNPIFLFARRRQKIL